MPLLRPRANPGFPTPDRSTGATPVDYARGTGKTFDAIHDGRSSRDRTGDDAKSYLGKVITFIPVESVALYQAILNASDSGKDPFFVPLVWAIALLTPAWQLYATYVPKRSLAWDQAIVSFPALLFWLVGLNSPFIAAFGLDAKHGWTGSYSTVVLIVGSMLLPVLSKLVLWIEVMIRGRAGR